SVDLSGAVVNFRQYAGDEAFNFEFFFDYFKPQGPRDTTKQPVVWTIFSDRVHLHETSFSFRVDDDTVTGRNFRENDFRFNAIEAEMHDFTVVDDSLHFHIHRMALEEKNSFKVKKLVADAIIHARGMEFSNLWLETPNSLLKDYLAFSYSSWDAFGEFVDEVELKAGLKEAKISFLDIREFSDELKDWRQVFFASGDAGGVLKTLKSR